MVKSQNGYPANDVSQTTVYTVTKDGRVMRLRKGPAGEMLARFVRWFDENVRDIDLGILDDWSYAERPIRGGSDLSNHASGTAADVDATKWPLGVEATSYLTTAEIAKVHAELARYEGCIRWGADYYGRKDPMHFEIDRDEATVARVLAQLEQEEEDMPLTKEDAQKVADALLDSTIVVKNSKGEKTTPRVRTVLAALVERDITILKELDEHDTKEEPGNA